MTIRLDTVSAESTYFMGACISTSTHRGDCITPKSKTRVTCSFGNPILFRCPVRSYVLPENGGRYYIFVSGLRLLPRPEDGRYVINMTAHPGTGPLGLEADNIAYDEIQ